MLPSASEDLTPPKSVPFGGEDAHTPRGQHGRAAQHSLVVPDYQLSRIIGRGAYGEVWLARSATGLYRAVKVVRRSMFDHDRPFDREFDGIQKFEPISHSEDQVHILHVGRNDSGGYFYYVMELADDANQMTGGSRGNETQKSYPEEGGQIFITSNATGAYRDSPPSALESCRIASYVPLTLKRLLLDHGAPPAEQCLEIALALSRALAHLHKNGLVHRDVKPSNVIFVNGIAKLADVGLVTSVDATRSFVGTEGYFPPEGPGTPQADIYSLGKLLYELSTGCDRSQFPALPPDIATRPDRNVVSEINAIIVHACQLDPRRRYQSAEALHADLMLLRRGGSIRHRRSVHDYLLLVKWLLAAACVIAALLAARHFLSLGTRRPLTVLEFAVKAGTRNVEAYKLYEKGRAAFLQRNAEAYRHSIEFTRQAVRLDPRFSRAWGLLFWLHDGMPEQLEIAATLERLDQNSADAHAARGWLAYLALDLKKADTEFALSIARDGTCAWARFAYAIFLTQCGRLADARAQLAILEDLEASNNGVPSFLGDCFFVERRFPEAIAKYKESFQLSQRAPRPHSALASAYEATGHWDEAINEAETARLLDGVNPELVTREATELRTALHQGGARGYWSTRLTQLERFFNPENLPYAFAELHARLEQRSKALDLLESAWKKRDRNLRFLLIDEAFDPLRKEPRYTNLIDKIGFQKNWPPR